MADTGPVSSPEQFAARLDDVRARAGSASGYEAAVTALAHDLPTVRWGTVLKIARAGFSDAAVLPSTAPGREAALAEELWDHLVAAGYDRSDRGDLGLAVPAYVALPARDDFNAAAGSSTSLDAHTLCMIVVERVLQSVGGVHVDAPAETALFRWLYARLRLEPTAEPTAEQLADVVARRRLRREASARPAGEVAASLCVHAPPAGWLDGVLERTVSGPFSADQLGEMLEQLAAGEEQGSTRWEDCRRGFSVGGEIDLTAASPADSAYAHGLLLRWLVDQDVPVTAARMRWAESYARLVLAFLAPNPSRELSNAPLQAHHLALTAMRRDGASAPPLAEELLLVAWLCGQQHLGLDVSAFLKSRADFVRLVGGQVDG